MRLGQKSWVRAAMLVGLLYALVGVTFAIPTNDVRAWRLAAWAVSGVLYAAHIAYEHFTLRDSPRIVATHVAFAAALGAFGLAVAANIHSLSSPSAEADRRLLLIALVAWPVITALPAFLVGLGIDAALSRLTRRADAG